MPRPSATPISSASACGVIMVPVGLAGLATRMPASGRCACAARKLSPVIAQRAAAAGLDQHRLAAERGEDVPIGRITGVGDRDAVARLEQRKKSQDEAGRRAGGDDDAIGLDADALDLVVVTRDARPQRGECRALRCSRAGRRRAPRAPPRAPPRRAAPPAGRPPCERPGRPRPRCGPPPPSRPSP